MNLAEIIKTVSKQLNISGMELARRSGQSPQNLSKKLVKGTLSFEEFEQLMELMGVRIDLSYTLPGQESGQVTAYDRHVQYQLTILEKQLEVERLKNKYFADMSYEFRTALGTVDGGIKLAIAHSDNRARVEDYLNKVKPAVNTLTRLVEDNPFNREAGIGTVKTGGESQGTKLKGKQVLLVDDNDLNREIVKELLEDSKMIVTEASNGRDALELVSKDASSYDFVLMDLQMPIMDGFESARQIRALKDARKAGVKIIAMTASVTYEDRESAKSAGMNGFIEKPLDLKKLENVVLG